MVNNRAARWISALIVTFIVASVLPAPALAAENPEASFAPLRESTILIDTPLYAEPSAESTVLAMLVPGDVVTVMSDPQLSSIDGAAWIQVATLQALGYVHAEAIVDPTSPSDSIPNPVIAWETIHAYDPVACRADPSFEAQIIGELLPGESVGLTGAPLGDWQPVLCSERNAFIPNFALTAQAPVSPDPVETPESVETPAPEPQQTVVPDPSSTPESTPDPVAPVPAPEDPVVEIAALITGTAIVTGTGGTGVRCRASADLSGPVITVLPEGAQVSLRGAQSGSWQPVVCAGQNGFVWASYLHTGGGQHSGTGTFGTVQNTNGDGLRCRATPSISGAVITVLAPGTTVPTRGPAEGLWQPVICANQNGWVHTDYFSTSSSSSPGAPSGGDPVQHSFVAGQSARVSGTDGTGVRFRSSASFTSAIIAVLPEGTGVTVRAGSTGVWVAVTFGSNNGFIHMDYLSPASGSPPAPTPAPGGTPSSDLAVGSHALVTDSLRLRNQPSFSGETLAVAPSGTVVKITGAKTNGFYPVLWDDLSGFMHGDYLSWTSQLLSDRNPAPPSGTIPAGNAGNGLSTAAGMAIVDYAMQYLGYPYVWATRGPNSFDCSGFTYWVFKNVVGRDIGGGTWGQWGLGSPIPYGSLQPGDLVFFQNTYTAGLSHVGIYIGGNQFIHAANEETGVIISNLTSTYYATRWYGARRLV